jgi:hypothetical protein
MARRRRLPPGGGIDASHLPALAFYNDTILPQLRELNERKSHGKQ